MPSREATAGHEPQSVGESPSLAREIGKTPGYVRLDDWEPPRQPIFPHIRLGTRWFNTLWLLPLGGAALVLGVTVCHELRQFSAVQQFIARYPGHSSTPVAYEGFPLWLRLQHYFNIVMMMFIIRSGWQILADHPRLYWNQNSTPGTEWFRFNHAVPEDRVWTAKEDAVSMPGWMGIPGQRHTIGLARWWHLCCDLFWLLNGLLFYILLFSTNQWQRLVPTSWDLFPNAASTLLQYLSLQLPVDDGWVRYNSLQQLAYFFTVFVAAPLAVFTGLMQAPAISNRFGWLARLVNRQRARSIHFLIMLWFLQFIAIHVTMVLITGVRRNLNHITLDNDTTHWSGLVVALIGLGVVAALWVWVSPFTLRNARLVQLTGTRILGGLKGWLEMIDPRTQYTEKDIGPHLWANGLIPTTPEYQAMTETNFADYRLKVGGLVADPRELSLEELKGLPRQEQITAHFCIQGWSGVAKWAGVPVTALIDLVKPLPEARYVVFYSLGEGGHGGMYFDVHTMANMRHHLSLLAYEMNGKPLPILYGAPLRLRCENELGFKMVKWIHAIEFVADYGDIGDGQGGYNEDHEFYGNQMPI